MLEPRYEDFLNIPEKQASFNTGEFEELLTTIRDYEEKGYVMPGNIRMDAEGRAQAVSGMTEEERVSYYKSAHNALLMNYYINYYSQDKTDGALHTSTQSRCRSAVHASFS
ncbi:MAG: hypothetical protein LBS84_05145 [Clostridiales bacterium]|nr:hypothetical protein [Clostridiales bacterium]